MVEKYKKYVRDVNVIPWELHHRLVVVGLNKKVRKKNVRKKWTSRKRMWKLSENQKRFKKELKKLVTTDSDSWKTSRIVF